MRYPREIVDKLIEGDFDYDIEKLVFDLPRIEETLSVGQLFEGNFTLKSVSGESVEGDVYTSNMRLVCRNGHFSGSSAMIHYVFDPTGLEPGDEIKGDIRIVSDAGEYYIPFIFSIVHSTAQSTMGAVRNLFHFTNQAQVNFKEAVELFYSDEFMRVFDGNDRTCLTQYRGFTNNPGDPQAVDDFLVSVNKKHPVVYSAGRDIYEFNDVSDEISCEISIRKSTWGYVDVELSSDAPFIRLEKFHLSDEDFDGNEHLLRFDILEDMLHEGKNFGRIRLSSKRGDLDITIVARFRKSDDAVRIEHREMEHLLSKLVGCYISFRTKHINVNSWVRESMKVVERMNSLDDKNPLSRLYQAQLLMVEERFNEARWILEHVEKEMNIRNSSPEKYCYFLYLTTMLNRTDEYIDEVAGEIERYNARYPKDVAILWMLLYLDEEISNSNARKLSMIESAFNNGVTSPVLYIEAFNCYASNPATLSRLTEFEFQVINFALKHCNIGSELIMQIVYLTGRQREYSDKLSGLLAALYEKYRVPELLEVLCSFLIKGNKTDIRYHKWYRLSVEHGFRITKLYEYFMYSVPMTHRELIPRAVIMYFGYSNPLDFHRKAYLYANLIRFRKEAPELYEANHESMLVFAIEQIDDEHIDENLALIYEDVLYPEIIKPDMANHLAKLLFACEVKTSDKRWVNTVLVEDEMVDEVIYPIEDGFSYPSIYSRNSTLFYEDSEGRREIVPDSNVRRLMNEALFLPHIKYYVTGNLPFFLYLCEGKKHYISVDADNAGFCRDIVESDEIAERFKADVRIGLLHFYYDNDQISTLDEFLINIDVKLLNSKDRAEVVDFLVRRALYDRAYELVSIYGAEGISAKSLVKICSHMIEKNDRLYDVMLVKISYYAFRKGKYDSNTLKYLVDNYNGLTKELRDLWKAANDFDIDTYAIMDKLIIQMLYTRTTVGEKGDIFDDYVKRAPGSKTEMAYLSYQAYDYFVKERMMSRKIFEYLLDIYRQGEDLNDACKLALLKFYAEEEFNHTERIKEMISSFVQEFLHRNIYFRFFNAFIPIVPELSAFNDAVVVEYRTNPKNRVVLHYILEDDDNITDIYRTEEMRNMFGGIFSKEFILFFGENLQYYVTEERNGKEQLTLSDTVSVSETVADSSESRFSLLNDMVVSKTLQDDATLIDIMKQYVNEDYFAEKVFAIR